MVGKTISHYRVLEKLGEGGMGVVYKAKDTHLDRLVAVKLLPAERVADPERKRRFIQEAKAASALNHPNIITIYDIDQADGLHFIAMEYVAGKTLDQLIGRKGLKLSETLKCAVQVADALAAAHTAGIIHRDLKPANIMVTEKGLVKVLDFGLAKLTEDDSGYEGETLSAKDAPRTEEGAILGTIAYMSPEQAEGKKVDARSDIFSFGSVLYETITGRRAFRGETRVSTLSAILREEPQPISSIAEDVPRDLEKVVVRCLRKDPARRFQHMDDVKIALQELKEESDSGKLITPAAQVSPGARSKRAIPWALALLAICAAGIFAVRAFRAPTGAPAVTRFSIAVPAPLTVGDVALSDDGSQLAYNALEPASYTWQLYVRPVSQSDAFPIGASEPSAWAPFFSPDNRWLVF